MATKLGEMLVSAGRITLAQLNEALKSQVIFGGKLGTNLIEMGFLEEDELAAFLSKKMALPCVTSDQISSVPEETISLLPRELAEKYQIIPMSLEKKRLSLAMLDPTDLALMDEISFVTGYVIIPMIAPEVLLVLALERHYGVKPDNRFIQFVEKIKRRDKGAHPPQTEEKKEIEAPGAAAPIDAGEMIIDAFEEIYPSAEVVRQEPARIEPAMAKVVAADAFVVEPIAVNQLRSDLGAPEAEPEAPPEPAPISAPEAVIEPEPITELEAPPVAVAAAVTATLPPPEPEAQPVQPPVSEQEIEPAAKAPPDVDISMGLTVDSLAERLAEAKDREEIADLLIAYFSGEFDRVVLFMIKGNTAVRWRGQKNGKPLSAAALESVYLEERSVLQVVTEGKSCYLGTIPETAENGTLISALDGPPSSSALLLPLTLMGRVVAVLCMDGGKTPPSDRLTELQKLVGKASMAFEILILKNKILMT